MAGKSQIRLLLRDINADMVSAWSDLLAFGADKYKEFVQVYKYFYWFTCLKIDFGRSAAETFLKELHRRTLL